MKPALGYAAAQDPEQPCPGVFAEGRVRLGQGRCWACRVSAGETQSPAQRLQITGQHRG